MKRIVSLVPSLTEAVCDLGLEKEVVGITNFCTHPKSILKMKERVGGTKDPDLQKIKSLKPTHILVNSEENKPEHIQFLSKISNVIETDVRSVVDTLDMYDQLGRNLDCLDEANKKKETIRNLIAELSDIYNAPGSFKALYFIWKDPWMCVSDDTYIADVLRYFGIQIVNSVDISKGEAGRYPEIDISRAEEYGACVCLFSSEPWPFRIRDIKAFDEQYKGEKSYFKVDGKDFSWYGSSTLTVMKKALQFKSEGLEMFRKVVIT